MKHSSESVTDSSQASTPKQAPATLFKRVWLLLKWVIFPLTTSIEIQEKWHAKKTQHNKPTDKE